jgi:hypothetical protein
MAIVTTADNTTLYVKDWGVGQAVVLLHGWPLSCDTWDEQAMSIAQSGYRVYSSAGTCWVLSASEAPTKSALAAHGTPDGFLPATAW